MNEQPDLINELRELMSRNYNAASYIRDRVVGVVVSWEPCAMTLFHNVNGVLSTASGQRSGGLVRRDAPATSRAAAAKVDGAGKRAIVLDAIKASADGLTDEQIVSVTGLAPNTARPRRKELADGGLIEAIGTRLTVSGCRAQVWRATTPKE